MPQRFSKQEEAEIRQRLSYDPDTGFVEWLSHNYRKFELTVAGSPCRKGYIRIHICGKKVAAHRVAWFLHHGEWPRGDIDHINGVKSDNRMINLRCVTRSQNCMNKKGSGVKGVGYYRKYDCYRARIMVGGKSGFLGYFDDIGSAEEAYKVAAEKLQGEYRFLPNHERFPEGITR